MENPERTAVLSLTGKHWQLPDFHHPPALTATHDLPPWVATLLARRGIADGAAVRAYLDPSLASLEDPALMADMDCAINRVLAALRSQEPIAIYGDYDVDGVCATSIMMEFLRDVGGRVSYYIPDRRAEGYGLNGAAVSALAGQARVLITVDCGVTAVEEITLARQLGVDVVIVDHHQVPAVRPPAIACLNPHRDDCAFPFKGLCAAGVAFMFVAGLRRALRQAGMFRNRVEPDLRALLDLVAVATIADMVPIYGSNRVLVAAGLRRLAQAPRPGLAALCAVAKVNRARISSTDLGFRLGPRINARGRMSQAGLAVELMLTRDADAARRFAALLDTANEERRQVEKATVEAAHAQVDAQGLQHHAALVVHDPSWHPGVLGLVASRLANHYHRPALVIGADGKGSGRSIEGVNLHAALQAMASMLLRFGGHPAAAGVTVDAARVTEVRAALDAQVRTMMGTPPYTATLKPDLEFAAEMLTLDTVHAVQRLAPFGQGNPEPMFVARQLPVSAARVVGQAHLKLRFGHLDAIGFGMGNLLETLPSTVDAAFHLERNEYMGQVSPQLRLVDLRMAGSPR